MAQLRARKWLLVCVLGLVMVVLLPNLLVVQDEPSFTDAILVIGGDHKPARVQQAVELYQQGYAPLVIISAGTLVQEGSEWMAEAEVMRRQALQLGLPEEVLIIEDHSLSIIQNARYSGEVCEEYGIKSIVLVTSAYHSRRARHIFRQELGEKVSVHVQPAPRGHHPLLWWLYPDQAYTVLYEYKNLAEYWLGLSR
jgi:uncharacterized SAM-binding protein YcdF (DUF218 family)